MGKWKGLPRTALCFIHLVEMGEVKGLPRATSNYHKIEEMGGGGAASNHPLM